MNWYGYAISLLLIGSLAGCGGGGGSSSIDSQQNTNPSPVVGNDPVVVPQKVKLSSMVSFGDSLSDVGTYSVGAIKALGGGKFTVNSPQTKLWVESLAEQL